MNTYNLNNTITAVYQNNNKDFVVYNWKRATEKIFKEKERVIRYLKVRYPTLSNVLTELISYDEEYPFFITKFGLHPMNLKNLPENKTSESMQKATANFISEFLEYSKTSNPESLKTVSPVLIKNDAAAKTLITS